MQTYIIRRITGKQNIPQGKLSPPPPSQPLTHPQRQQSTVFSGPVVLLAIEPATSRSSQTLCVDGVGCGVVSRALQVLSQVFLSGAEGALCFLSGARHSTADLSNYHTPGPWRRGGSAHSLPTLQPILCVSHTRTRTHTHTHTHTH